MNFFIKEKEKSVLEVIFENNLHKLKEKQINRKQKQSWIYNLISLLKTLLQSLQMVFL